MPTKKPRKNPFAQGLARTRWSKTSKAQRLQVVRDLNAARRRRREERNKPPE